MTTNGYQPRLGTGVYYNSIEGCLALADSRGKVVNLSRMESSGRTKLIPLEKIPLVLLKTSMLTEAREEVSKLGLGRILNEYLESVRIN